MIGVPILGKSLGGLDDKEMDLLEEVGFKKVSNNEVKNPQLPVNPQWLDQVSKRTAATPGGNCSGVTC